MKANLALIGALAVSACGPAAAPRDVPPRVPEPTPQAIRDATTAFRSLHEAFLEWYYEADPVRASELGVHTHASTFAPMGRGDIQRRIDALLDWDRQLSRIPLRLMRDGDRFDHAVLEFAIRAELLEVEEIRRWATAPQMYTDMIARGLAVVTEVDYAPADQRAAALRGRLTAAPEVLAAARANVRTPPRIWTELAITRARFLLEYVEAELPALMAEAGTASAGIEAARAELADALRAHIDWLEGPLLAASTGDFRLGRYFFARLLLYNEHVDVSLNELERLNDSAIADYRAQLEAVAAEIDPARTPAGILDSIADLRPEPDALVGTVRALMLEARDRVLAAELVTIPADRVPAVRESPAYARHEPVSLRAPGPFDAPGTDGYVNITTVDPEWSPERQAGHRAYFNDAVLPALVVHETIPGRYIQRLRQRNAPSDARRVFATRGLTGGWGHYAEQMMFDAGFRQGDPVARLGQVQRALERHARWYAAIHLHAQGESLDVVVGRFMEIAHVPEHQARREVLRVTHEPLYFADALGRMQILELRRGIEAAMEDEDEEFTLRQFHDRFLDLGLPLPLATDALLDPPAQDEPPVRRTPTRIRRP